MQFLVPAGGLQKFHNSLTTNQNTIYVVQSSGGGNLAIFYQTNIFDYWIKSLHVCDQRPRGAKMSILIYVRLSSEAEAMTGLVHLWQHFKYL